MSSDQGRFGQISSLKKKKPSVFQSFSDFGTVEKELWIGIILCILQKQFCTPSPPQLPPERKKKQL